jgi:hypothetical protein
LSKAMEELLALIFEEQAASAERRNKSSEKPIHAVAAMTIFTMPEPKSAKS